MEAFLVSTGIVALAEMGDKTQLLALVLAARFRKPWPIVLGILVATVANHALAGALGTWVTTVLGPDVLRWVLGISFIAMAAWMLIPDTLDEGDDAGKAPRLGVFGTTVLAFFLAEMGDKTQIATVMLAAQYQTWFWVVAGTTLGHDAGQRAGGLVWRTDHPARADQGRPSGVGSRFRSARRSGTFRLGLTPASVHGSRPSSDGSPALDLY